MPPGLVCMLIAAYVQTCIPQFLRKHIQKKMHSLRMIVLNVYVQRTLLALQSELVQLLKEVMVPCAVQTNLS